MTTGVAHDGLPVLALVLSVALLAGGLGVALRASGRTVGSLGLLAVLVGFFALFVLLGPASQEAPGLAAALFFAALGVFRLMTRFESTRPANVSPSGPSAARPRPSGTAR